MFTCFEFVICKYYLLCPTAIWAINSDKVDSLEVLGST